MAAKPKILCFAGSLRRDSLNKKLVKQAAAIAEKLGAEITCIDLKDYPMPFYDGDVEAESGLPENALKIKQLMKSHDAFLIASPEYNSSISGVLKNTIDWASRPEKDEKPLACFSGKVAALMAASPGPFGGMRGLVILRMLLSNIGVVVVPEQLAIGKANDAFDQEGKLTDEKNSQSLERSVQRVFDIVRGQLLIKES